MRRKTNAKRNALPKIPWFALSSFFSLFLISGIVGLFMMYIYPTWKSGEAAKWDKAPCEILSSEVTSSGSSNGNTYRLTIKYSYEYNSTTYSSDNFSFAAGSASGREPSAVMVQKYPKGELTECYVNPEDPTESVIHLGLIDSIYFATLFPLALILIGLGGIIFALKMCSRIKELEANSEDDALHFDSENAQNISRAVIESPPDGAWFRREVDGVVLGATVRSFVTPLFFIHTLMFSVFALVMIFNPDVFESSSSKDTDLLGITLGIMNIPSWLLFIFFAFGKVEVTVARESSVFTGLGGIGWRRKFNWADVKSIKEVESSTKVNNTQVTVIQISGDGRIKFGLLLRKARKRFLLNALLYLQQESKNMDISHIFSVS